MPKRDIIQEAEDTIQALQQINPGLQVGDVSMATLENAFNLAVANRKQITAAEKQVTDLSNERVVLLGNLWDMLKRLRNGIKGIYGDNSSQYEMIGGTRMSEKKKPAKKTPPATPTTTTTSSS